MQCKMPHCQLASHVSGQVGSELPEQHAQVFPGCAALESNPRLDWPRRKQFAVGHLWS